MTDKVFCWLVTWGTTCREFIYPEMKYKSGLTVTKTFQDVETFIKDKPDAKVQTIIEGSLDHFNHVKQGGFMAEVVAFVIKYGKPLE